MQAHWPKLHLLFIFTQLWHLHRFVTGCLDFQILCTNMSPSCKPFSMWTGLWSFCNSIDYYYTAAHEVIETIRPLGSLLSHHGNSALIMKRLLLSIEGHFVLSLSHCYRLKTFFVIYFVTASCPIYVCNIYFFLTGTCFFKLLDTYTFWGTVCSACLETVCGTCGNL